MRHNFMQDSCLMKLSPVFWFMLAMLLGLARVAQAEKADRDKPMNVEADALRYDDARQLSVFTGRVVLTKGTIQIRGDRIEVRQDAQGNQFGVVTGEPGKRAFFRQKREGLDEFIEGESLSIDYDGRGEVVKFIGQAQLRRLQGIRINDEFNGALIVYNQRTDMFTLDGTPADAKSGAATQGQGRVRAMLTPRPQAPGSAAGSPLRATPQLDGASQ